MARAVRNDVKAVINEEALQRYMLAMGGYDKQRGMTAYKTTKDLYADVKSKYGLDISYKTFMNLTTNKTEWYLTYAMCICDFFKCTIDDMFYLIPNKEEAIE